MITDNSTHIIVSNSHGCFSACAGTVDNARSLLNAQLANLSSDVAKLLELRRSGSHCLVGMKSVHKAFKDVMSLEVGSDSAALSSLLQGSSQSPELHVERPATKVTQAMKDELVLWAFRVGVTPTLAPWLTADFLNEPGRADTLSLLTRLRVRAQVQGADLVFVEDPALATVEELLELQDCTWAEDAGERSIVSRYLSFISEHLVDRADVQYNLVLLKPVL